MPAMTWSSSRVSAIAKAVQWRHLEGGELLRAFNEEVESESHVQRIADKFDVRR